MDIDVAFLVRHCLYGMDVDPVAVACVRVALCSMVTTEQRDSVREHLRQHVLVQNALTMTIEHPFDVVMANPPWCNLSLNPTVFPLYEPLLDSFPRCRDSGRRALNTAHFFLEQMANVLVHHGRFMVMVPDTLLLSDMCLGLLVHPGRSLRIDGLWSVAMQTVWKDFVDQGVIGIFGQRESGPQPYTYFFSDWNPSTPWSCASSAHASQTGTLRPNATVVRILSQCSTRRYGSVDWISCTIGPQNGPKLTNTTPSRMNSHSHVTVHKGSSWRLRYVCDESDVLPHKQRWCAARSDVERCPYRQWKHNVPR